MKPPDQTSSPGYLRALNILSWLILGLAVFSLAFVPLRGSQDEWWQLKAGQYIWQHGELPVNDIFTYTGENIRWYNHEWLSQLIFYGSYSIAENLGKDGIVGLILFKSIVVVAGFFLVAGLARQRGIAWPTACVIALVAADISRRTIYPRPPIFSYFLFALFLLLLYGWKRGTIRFRTLWIMAPITILWANLHGMVLLSFLAVGAFAGGELLENTAAWWQDRWRGAQKSPAVILTRAFWGLCALTVALILAAMLQPSGYHLFFLGRNFTADPLLQEIILEMLPTPAPFALRDPLQPWWLLDNLVARPPGFWTFWIALVIMFALFVRNRFRLPYAADYLLLGFFTYQGVMHWRLLPLFAIAAAGPAASLVYTRVRSWQARPVSFEAPVFSVVLILLVGWFNFAVSEPPPETFFRRNIALLQGKTGNLSDYPSPLMDYIIEADLPDHMFSDSNYCGYFIWRLSPEHHKLFTDNRFDVFGSEFIRKERAVFYAANLGDKIAGETVAEGWQEILDNYNVNFIVFRPLDRTHLFHALMDSDEWRIIYYYIAPEAQPRQWPLEGYYVWVREIPEADAIAERSEAIFKRQFPGQPVPAEVARLISRSLP